MNDTDALLSTDTSNVLDESIRVQADRHERRGYIGMSSIGKEDLRELWLDWRWSFPSEEPARVLRIFRLGHHIEREVVILLKMIPGVTVTETDPITGKQFEFSDKGGHVGGHSDGKIIGLPAAPVTEHTLEIKSAKDSEFKIAKKVGIDKWRPEYGVQIRLYMERQNTSRGLFVVYNKDTSEIYTERMYPQVGHYDRIMDRVDEMLSLEEPPETIYPNRNFYKIKNFKSDRWQRIYWNEEIPPMHCRNCRHVEPRLDGEARWFCHKHNRDMAVEMQRIGCPVHSYSPAFLAGSYDFIQEHPGVMRYREKATGVEFWNVEDVAANGAANMVFTSEELYALSAAGQLNQKGLSDPMLFKLREAVGGLIKHVKKKET